MPTNRAREADRLLDDLDPEQRRVATTFGAPVVVVAGAGTGKTRAITYRIAYGSLTGAYHAPAVLAVTFTTRAAGELRHRLARLGVPNVQARTFHSAALRQAQFFWPRAYGSELPPVADDRHVMVAEAARQLHLGLDAATLRDVVTEISWAKVSNVAAGDYPDVASAARRAVAGVDAGGVGRILGRYEHVKNARGVIDFDDILLCACALLGEHPGVADEVRRTYRHLVVDEYQDVSPLQQTLLGLWCGDGDDLCVVGDPAQTIHSFAGATPEYLLGFTRRFPAATSVALTRDYRSTPQVVRLANRIARRGRLGAVELASQRPAGPEPVVTGFDTEPAEAAGVAQWLTERHRAGVPWRELAVLYRVHAQSPLFESALADAGIPFSVRGADGFFERAEVRQAMRLLQEQAARDPAKPALRAARDVLTRLGWTEDPPAGQGRVRERWESWAALFALAGDVASATVSDLVAELGARTGAEHAPHGDGVTLSSMHAAKGLEWEGVAVVGVHEGTLPFALATTPAQLAEEGRLLYVAVSRARTQLLVTWSRARRDGGGTRQRSRFLDGLGGADSGRSATVHRTPYRPGTAMNATCRVCGASLATGAEHKLGRHLDCAADYDEEVLARLTSWRAETAAAASLPAFAVLTDATLMAIAEARPSDLAALVAVPGVGTARATRYGAAVLEIVAPGAH